MEQYCLLGAIAGDVIGSPYEFWTGGFKKMEFPLFSEESVFTDDTILSMAVADAIMSGKSYHETILTYSRRYPSSYGVRFDHWIHSANPKPYNSLGNGSAMRVSPVAWAFDTLGEVLDHAEQTAAVTHNHPEGIKGAQAVALAVFRARTDASRDDIRSEITDRFGYNLRRTLDEIRPAYKFKETCMETVPEALTAFFESADFEDAIRKAVSLGGDADTLAAITGSIAEAYYGGVPASITAELQNRLPPEFWQVVTNFSERFSNRIYQRPN